MKTKIKKGDTVAVIAGKDQGRKGKVLRVIPTDGRVVVEGMNIRKKHVRAKRANEKGQVVQQPGPFHISNVQLFCEKCSSAARVGIIQEGDKRSRICKKCKATL
ncbi:MAG: 50S ribosomal protein L24 [bacterium]|nr:50S ribosomal protein L24 [bacterium]